MTSHDLKSLINDKIDGRWSDWSARHPNLAAVIDRTRLIETATKLLREDPAYIDAMRAADLDEAKLATAANILDRVNKVIREAMPL